MLGLVAVARQFSKGGRVEEVARDLPALLRPVLDATRGQTRLFLGTVAANQRRIGGGNRAIGLGAVPDPVQIQTRRDAIVRLYPVAAQILVLAHVERLMQIADEVREEHQRFELLFGGQAPVRQQPGKAFDLPGHANAVGALGLDVERLAHGDVLVVPRERVGPAPAFPAHAIRPDRGILEALHRAVGRQQFGRGMEDAPDLRPRVRRDVLHRDRGDGAVAIGAPGHGRRGGERYERRDQQEKSTHRQVTGISYCSITQSSASAAAIHCCIHSCSHTACI